MDIGREGNVCADYVVMQLRSFLYMISRTMVKHRAMLMGVLDGEMPEVEFIWEMQRAAGEWECFGQGIRCNKRGCRWWKKCMALEDYSDMRLLPDSGTEIDEAFEQCLRK